MAIIAGFYWFWIPICAAATCAGGGLLLGICTGASHARLPERYMKSSLIGLMSLAHRVADIEAFIVSHSLSYTVCASLSY